MPIEVGLWKLGDRLKAIQYSRIASEKQLESLLAADVSVIDSDLMLIGRQVATASGGFIDLLALDSSRRVVAIELMQDRTHPAK
jgi:RecB family endonuclease NucS